MLLIITHKQDYTADFLIDKLNRLHTPFYRFNCEEINQISYNFHFRETASSLLGGHSNFTSVWYRRTKLPVINSNIGNQEKAYLYLEYQALLDNILHSISAKKWLSHPDAIYKAENKLLQLSTAIGCGFNIPDTLVTNDKDEIVKFAECYGHNIVIKPLNSGRIRGTSGTRLLYTNKVSREHIENIKEYEITPFILQNNIAKNYEIRATIVNKKVFAAMVNSQDHVLTQTDWRKHKLKFERCILPNEIEMKCIDIVETLGLSFGAIDLIRTPEDEYIFLEINPNGQWAWIEKDTTLPISQEIINFLVS